MCPRVGDGVGGNKSYNETVIVLLLLISSGPLTSLHLFLPTTTTKQMLTSLTTERLFQT